MEFVTVRELRTKPAGVWRRLERIGTLVLTSNGRPIGVLTSTSGADLERTLDTMRRARALAAVDALQRDAVKRGRDRLDRSAIDREIRAVRHARRR